MTSSKMTASTLFLSGVEGRAVEGISPCLDQGGTRFIRSASTDTDWLIFSFCCADNDWISCNISSTKFLVWAFFQTPGRELKIRPAAEYIYWNIFFRVSVDCCFFMTIAFCLSGKKTEPASLTLSLSIQLSIKFGINWSASNQSKESIYTGTEVFVAEPTWK